MNERIKELYDQATVYYSNGYVNCPELDWKKFAELLIQKCAMISNHAYDGREYPGKMIKKYFGVE
jgi:hypothetical protein